MTTPNGMRDDLAVVYEQPADWGCELWAGVICGSYTTLVRRNDSAKAWPE
jgi:hypothetical protein